MRQSPWLRLLALAGLTLLLGGCSETYSYIPTVGTAQAPPAGAPEPAPGPAPTAAEPVAAAPRPDLNQQVQALEARVQALEGRLAALEQSRPAAPAVSGAGGPRAKATAAVPPQATAAYPKASAAVADKTYNEGLRLYQGKKYGAAREKFSQYLKEQPRGSRAAEARYHLADCFYLEGKYKEAAVEFNKLASQHPQSILAPAALLRQALSYKNLNQTPTYQSTLRKLVQAYPKSPEAREAQKWLKEGSKPAKR